MDLARSLTAAGMSAKEAAVYLALAQLGTAGAAEIARRAEIKRPTAYTILEGFAAEGLIDVAVTSGRRRYSVDSPRRLLELPRRQEKSLREAMPELLALCGGAPTKPRVRLYEGKQGILRVSEDLLTVRSGEYRYIGGARDMTSVLGADYLRDYVSRRVALGIRSYALRVRSRELDLPFLADGEQWLRTVRLLDEPVSGDLVSLYIYDQRISVVSTQREGYGLVVESAELVALMMVVWRGLWTAAKPR